MTSKNNRAELEFYLALFQIQINASAFWIIALEEKDNIYINRQTACNSMRLTDHTSMTGYIFRFEQ